MQRSSEIWYSDGSVVLQAESTQFRVYRGLLAANSPLFKDIFTLPQPEKDSRLVDGCPVIVLQDSAQELSFFLVALHDARHRTLQPFNVAQVSAILRLSRKYQVEHLYEAAYPVLVSWHPTTLEDFVRFSETHADKLFPDPASAPETAIKILNLVHELGVRSLLPVAILRCARWPLETFLVGATTSNEHLALIDQIACAKAREKLLWAQSEIYAFTTRISSLSCDNDQVCPTVRLRVWAGVSRAWAGDVDKPSKGRSLQPWAPMLQWEKLRALLCRRCAEADERAFKAARASLWQRLPEICGLESWETLIKPIN